eukprot:506294-Prorocentrum_minimum.AAC.1
MRSSDWLYPLDVNDQDPIRRPETTAIKAYDLADLERSFERGNGGEGAPHRARKSEAPTASSHSSLKWKYASLFAARFTLMWRPICTVTSTSAT